MAHSNCKDILALLSDITAPAPKVIDLGLERLLKVAHQLDNPQNTGPKQVHIAGTNGKGSTLAYLAAILRAEGHKVHSFSSPHLIDWREAIHIDRTLPKDSARQCNMPPPQDHLMVELQRIRSALQHSGANYLTRFECETLLAFLLMASQDKEDFGLIEVGMGGGSDATNILKHPKAVILTPISIDHRDFLGDTLTDIATHKLGILKPGIPCVMSGDQAPEIVHMAREYAARLDTPLWVGGEDWSYSLTLDTLELQVGDKTWAFAAPKGLRGWRLDNTALAAAAATIVAPEMVLTDLSHLPKATPNGRLQPFKTVNTTEIWLDGAHNPHAAVALAKELANWRHIDGVRKMGLAVGLQSNRPAHQVLEHLAPHADRAASFPIEGGFVPGHSPKMLAQTLVDCGCTQATPHDNIASAISMLLKDQPDRILVTGSLRAVAAALSDL